MKHKLFTFFKHFLTCGLTGWCMEIVFTSLKALRRRELTLEGNTSLWMFPIYGSAALLTPLGRFLKSRPLWLRGTAYMSLIFSIEYLSGRLLSRHKICPWDYSRCRYRVGNVIRLDFAPLWFCLGLLLEHLTVGDEACPDSAARGKRQKTAR